jgi:hypothetical protein
MALDLRLNPDQGTAKELATVIKRAGGRTRVGGGKELTESIGVQETCVYRARGGRGEGRGADK